MPHWSTFQTETELRAAMVNQARQYAYAGLRYQHQGRSREKGVDCLGLLLVVAWDMGFDFELQEQAEGANDHNYSFDPNGYYLVERLSDEMIALPHWRDALPGDVVIQRWHISRPPQHVGIVSRAEAGNLICIHAARKNRRVVETRWDREDLITHAFRVREIAQLSGDF